MHHNYVIGDNMKTIIDSDPLNLKVFKPIIDNIVLTASELDVIKNARIEMKRALMIMASDVVKISKLTKIERKQVFTALKLLVTKGL